MSTKPMIPRLLDVYDFLKNKKTNFIGWVKTSQGEGGLFNPRGYAMQRIVICDENGKPLYDQPLLFENAGCIIIIKMGDKIALVQNFRMVGERILINAGANYITEINKNGLWENLVKSLGQWKWEAPRGLIQKSSETDEMKFIMNTAYEEALQEAGIIIKNMEFVGRLNTNSTFFAHAQYVVIAEVESVGNADPEKFECIRNMRFMDMNQLKELAKTGEFDDGTTLGAMALCGLCLPQD